MKKHDYLWMLIHNEFLPADISKPGISYESIFKMNDKELKNDIGLHKKQIEYIRNAVSKIDIERKYEEFLVSGAKAVTVYDDDYPGKLLDIEDRPFGLIYFGELPKEDDINIGIIGARACSEYGRVMAERLAVGLADKGANVISGMAMGIDGIAQMGALNAGSKSYGILGGGVDLCYPRGNRELYERLKVNGGVISEYGLSVPARSANFPKRNRIISGLSDGIVVIQARVRSGTFITVDDALSQGKAVMVVPGMVTDPLSVGCNMLIMQGAYPVQCAEDIINVIKSEKNIKKINNEISTKAIREKIPFEKENTIKAEGLDDNERKVLKVLDFTAKSIDEIAYETGLDLFILPRIFISLEMKELIKEIGKNNYVRCDL